MLENEYTRFATIQQETRKECTEECKRIIEEELGKKGTFSGSMGYQGIINGIHAIQTWEDQKRDKILTTLSKLQTLPE